MAETTVHGTAFHHPHRCEFEASFPPGIKPLDGTIDVTVTELGPYAVPPGDVIVPPERLEVCVEWELHGPLKNLICGQWCVCVDFHCYGKGPDFDFDRCRIIDFDCKSSGKFKECFIVEVKDIPSKIDRCTTVCEIIVTVALLDCNGKPSRVAGFCKAGFVQFVSPDVTPPDGD